MGFSSKVPTAAVKYFGTDVTSRELHPVIVSEFDPSAGWKRQSSTKRVSRSWLRKLSRQGITHVSLKSGIRQADFSVRELTAAA